MPEQDCREQAIAFDCEGETLIGVIAQPNAQAGTTGVVIVVGGPQYRAGSHRLFVSLARRLAAAGFATLRFDYRGMGDSTGPRQNFENVTPDIRAAVDALIRHDATLTSVVLWGLCDSASAVMMYGWQDARVAALVLANPWARSESSHARTQLRHYYVERLASSAFWRKLLARQVDLHQSWSELVRGIFTATRRGAVNPDFRERMADGLDAFNGPVQFIISGRDLTAREFDEFAHTRLGVGTGRGSGRWSWRRLDAADHTFSDPQARSAVCELTVHACATANVG